MTYELVRKAEVRSVVRSETSSKREVIEVAAETQKILILKHKALGRIRAIFMSLLAELEVLTNHRPFFEELGEVMKNGDLEQQSSPSCL